MKENKLILDVLLVAKSDNECCISEYEKKKGRPTKYTVDIAADICIRIACGESLNTICKSEHLPCKRTVMYWLETASTDTAPKHLKDFLHQYARAHELQIDCIIDEMLDIADDAKSEHVQRSKLRIDNRKWVLERQKPKKYGNQIANKC